LLDERRDEIADGLTTELDLLVAADGRPEDGRNEDRAHA
jgi:hypothetical protein